MKLQEIFVKNSPLIWALLLGSCSQNADLASGTLETGKDFPTYGGNNLNNRYSPLAQINADNVKDLEVVWTYFANDTSDTSTGRSSIQCQPIVVNGVLYGTSAELNLFALDAATGEQLWQYEPEPRHGHSNRGVSYWENGADRRILYTVGPFLHAVDAQTGKRITTFGEDGKTDLHAGLGDNLKHDVQKLSVKATSPGVIYQNTYIIGSSLPENGEAPPGHIRAFDVLTGKLKWVFHTIPQPGEFGYDTWPEGAYQKIGGANNWGGMALDEQRGVVYFGTGSPASDFYGGDREGTNLFSNCILALDAETGAMKWYFQGIHHDLWDRDFPCPPNLTTITHNGKRIDVVVQAGKDGNVYVLDRDTGESIFPFEERPVPTNGLPGEHPYPTQKFFSKPKPLSMQLMTEDDITDISPEAHDFVAKRFAEFPKMESRFQPPTTEGVILFGYSGGAEWGGNATDPDGILYQNANSGSPWELKMIRREELNAKTAELSPGNALYIQNCAVCHGAEQEGIADITPSLIGIGERRSVSEIDHLIRTGNGRMPPFPNLSESRRKAIIDFLLDQEVVSPSKPENTEANDIHAREPVADFPYSPEYVIKTWDYFTDHNGYPAVKPPWGTMNAIDLNTGDYLWTVPLGEFPELTAKGIPITGTPSYGGPVVTAGGLIFIASTRDERIRAFDKKTGATVWEYQLDAGAFATPITYEVNGKQYIAVAVGGGRGAKPGGWYVAFALK